jgi:DNA-binding LacI/PurR family transcriptional regulator
VPIRLRDVAERAGVSVKTVSNVVNGYTHVSDSTRSRVEKALAELGYQPNLSARMLRGGRSGVIALAVPALTQYFAEIAGLLEKALEKEGFILLIDQTEGRIERELLVVSGIRAHLIDGLIFSPLALGGSEIEEQRDTTPLVLLGERVSNGSVDHVAIDNVAAAREAVEHLIGLGRRRIAAIGTQRSASAENARMRLAGYREALSNAGLPYAGELVVPAKPWTRSSGLRSTRRLLGSKTPVDAIFAFNDEVAFGALRALYEAGVRVPEDVAVVGFDNVEEGRFSVPTLTTIAPDKEQIVGWAVTHLVSRLSGNQDRGPINTVVPHGFVRRESTLGATAGAQ